jgi:hypothetical protein
VAGRQTSRPTDRPVMPVFSRSPSEPPHGPRPTLSLLVYRQCQPGIFLRPPTPPRRPSSLSPVSARVRVVSPSRHDAAAPAAAAAAGHGAASACAGRWRAATAVGRDPATDDAAVRRTASGDVGPASAAGALRAGATPSAVLRRAACACAGAGRPRCGGRGQDALDRGPAVLDGRELRLGMLLEHRGGMGPDLIDAGGGCVFVSCKIS